jgi:Protein of unknown function (DUF3619)
MSSFNRPHALANLDTLQTRFGWKVAAALDEQVTGLPADIQTRLRFAREQALSRAKVSQTATAPAPSVQPNGRGAAILGGGKGTSEGWWMRLGVIVPVVVLVMGLVWIDRQHTRAQIEAAAEVDAELLADDLPPEAYSDPGFAEFLRSARP